MCIYLYIQYIYIYIYISIILVIRLDVAWRPSSPTRSTTSPVLYTIVYHTMLYYTILCNMLYYNILDYNRSWIIRATQARAYEDMA